MDSHLRKLASQQVDIVAAWQLRAAGWTWHKVKHHARDGGWRAIHPGVYVLTSAPLRREQLWFAAVLSAPGSALSHGSAAACYGFHRFERGFEVVTRPGQGGRRRHGRLLVFRSKRLDEDLAMHRRLPITTAARTLIDLAPGLDEKRLGRAFREAIRLKTTTVARVGECARRHEGRRGAARLDALASRYASIPYARTRSDAEGRALEVLHDAEVEKPRVNTRVAGEEADLVFVDRRLIVEIDGPQFHRFPDEDARKAEAWRAAGFTVRRVASGAVYEAPSELVRVAAAP
jgi:very-short-patch-repair endonuclease